ncbi:hypothetical protein [Comamonas aquatica]|uniref:hypothetical protein n=1 Tax=Comamonas aquatica TaxID=225991 RepID=UPI0024490363|nr:hypothetical protein [Comamonas aquatica]MDH0201140.1 hypothetical protein [Comamonas aquatica]MDH1446207.1 hypothetical protein [Comamonas aquatica]MDH1812880.1 hypothetical protein [Comamonas aquatica]
MSVLLGNDAGQVHTLSQAAPAGRGTGSRRAPLAASLVHGAGHAVHKWCAFHDMGDFVGDFQSFGAKNIHSQTGTPLAELCLCRLVYKDVFKCGPSVTALV